MSDLWDQLVDRALATIPAVRPRAPIPYERVEPPARSATDDSQEWTELTVALERGAPSLQSHDSPPRPESVAPALSPQPMMISAPSAPREVGGVVHQERHRGRPRVAEVPSPMTVRPVAQVQGTATVAATVAATDHRRADVGQPAQHSVGPLPTRSAAIVPRESSTDQPRQDLSATRLRASVAPSLDEAVGSVGPPIQLPSAVASAGSPVVPPARDAKELKPRLAAGRGTQVVPSSVTIHREMGATVPPAVHVTIGRLEIRAVPPARPEPKPVVTALPVRVTLEEYLKRRAEGK